MNIGHSQPPQAPNPPPFLSSSSGKPISSSEWAKGIKGRVLSENNPFFQAQVVEPPPRRTFVDNMKNWSGFQIVGRLWDQLKIRLLGSEAVYASKARIAIEKSLNNIRVGKAQLGAQPEEWNAFTKKFDVASKHIIQGFQAQAASTNDLQEIAKFGNEALNKFNTFFEKNYVDKEQTHSVSIPNLCFDVYNNKIGERIGINPSHEARLGLATEFMRELTAKLNLLRSSDGDVERTEDVYKAVNQFEEEVASTIKDLKDSMDEEDIQDSMKILKRKFDLFIDTYEYKNIFSHQEVDLKYE